MSILSRFKSTRIALEPQSTLPVKSPLEMVQAVTREYEDLLRRLFYRIDGLYGVEKNPLWPHLLHYTMKDIFKLWLDAADAQKKEDDEREKIAKIVREELETKVNKKCLKQS